MSLVDYDCGVEASHEGENIVYGPCRLRWRTADGDTLAVRLFNQILERNGRFKILNYGNQTLTATAETIASSCPASTSLG